MLRSIKNTGRLLRIGFILARHDALFVFEELKISPVLTMPLRLLLLSWGRRFQHGRILSAQNWQKT
jgi:hypothetical protein